MLINCIKMKLIVHKCKHSQLQNEVKGSDRIFSAFVPKQINIQRIEI